MWGGVGVDVFIRCLFREVRYGLCELVKLGG